jgi:hypothetical protein
MGMKVWKASVAIWESAIIRQPFTISPLLHTLFADFEHLVCFPSDDTSGESGPAPFHDTDQNLDRLAQ